VSLPAPPVETAWTIESRLGAHAEAAFVESVATGELDVVDLIKADWARYIDLMRQYADLRLGLVDASVVAVAERLGITAVATLNGTSPSCVPPTATRSR
jgi:predicted nucleic acid-binding protein